MNHMEQHSSRWPSQSSVLETPERKRYRHCVSFADSGLGSSLFGSPPTEQPATSTTSPVLRTPPTNSTGSPSPIRSFIHVSSYSASFSSPELKCSPSLSNPSNATGFRIGGKRPLKCAVQQTSCPSRHIRRFLDLSATSDHVCSPPPETPSKGFGLELLQGHMMDTYCTVSTSTPLRNELYRIPEQANGPLEMSMREPICNQTDAFLVASPCVSYKSATRHTFKAPKRRFKAYSRGWMRIACGGTAAQTRMTRMAHDVLNSRKSHAPLNELQPTAM